MSLKHWIAHKLHLNACRMMSGVLYCDGCDWTEDLYAQLDERVRARLEGRR